MSTSQDLSGRVVAITGASSGIGEATALAAAAAGAAVSLAARRGDRIEAIAERIRQEGGSAVAIPTDVTDEAFARAFVAGTTEALGGLDALVNNAGLMLLGAVTGADTQEWRRMIDVNCLGLLYCTHAAIEVMGPAGAGHIVNVSSVAGRRAQLGSAVYNMTKFGVVGFSEGLRQEVLHQNIRVTVVEPGWVETELLDHNNEFILKMAEERKAKMGTLLASEDIANAIIYALGQPPHVAVSEVMVIPTRQP